MKFQNKQMHNHFCFVSLLLDISNYFILHFFLEEPRVVQSRKKITNREKLKKIQKSWGFHDHYLCQESAYFLGPTVYIRDPQELRNQRQLWIQVRYNWDDSLENSSDSSRHSDFIFRPDLSNTGTTNHVWLLNPCSVATANCDVLWL